jgi:hypothetical protein
MLQICFVHLQHFPVSKETDDLQTVEFVLLHNLFIYVLWVILMEKILVSESNISVLYVHHYLLFLSLLVYTILLVLLYMFVCRSQWPGNLRHRFAATHLLRLWVQIPPGAWMCGDTHMTIHPLPLSASHLSNAPSV